MEMDQIVAAVVIHLIVPAMGIMAFLKLRDTMKSEQIVSPPIIEYFIIFATYGALLCLVLTSLNWRWSGFASLGIFYLILAAPWLMGIISYMQYKKRNISKYHKFAFIISALYYVILPTGLLIMYLSEPDWVH